MALENPIIKLGRVICAILVIENWFLQKSIFRTLQNEGKAGIANGKEWHRFQFRDKKKLSERVKYTQQNSDQTKI